MHKSGKVIMLYGYPLSGKSTAAAKIRDYLAKKGEHSEIISSAKLRLKGRKHGSTKGFIDERNSRTKAAKDMAYRKMCDVAGKLLQKGIIPIMDATHHLLYRRKWVYDLAAEANADVYVAWMSLGNEKTIRELLRHRMVEKKVSKLHTWEQYETMARQTERLEDNELIEQPGCFAGIVRFDRGKGTARFYGKADRFARQLADAVAKQTGHGQADENLLNFRKASGK